MIGKLDAIILDTPDTAGLVRFYAALAGLEISREDSDGSWAAVRLPTGAQLAFQQAPDHLSPQWPDPNYPQQFHLDLRAPDMAATVEQALRLGATRLDGGGDTWTVLADPSGHPFCVAVGEPDVPVGVADVAIDCPDGSALAVFYGELLGLPVTYSGDEGAMLSADGQLPVMFQNVAPYNPPQWPNPRRPQQFHLDVAVPDLDEGERQVLKLGATRLPGAMSDFRVFADPVGHPFCLVR
jgi:catechol-2,3-dioxygenase